MQETLTGRTGVIKTETSSRFIPVEPAAAATLSPPPVEVILTTSQNISESPQSVVATRTRDGKLTNYNLVKYNFKHNAVWHLWFKKSGTTIPGKKYPITESSIHDMLM